MAGFSYQRQVPYTREGLFDIVADVERYPDFLPGWRDARILDRHGDELTVRQTLGLAGLRWTFHTRVTLHPPRECLIETDERPFRHLFERWRFEALEERRTLVTFEADYELRDWAMRRFAALTFRHGFRQALHAFERRARARLGGPSGRY